MFIASDPLGRLTKLLLCRAELLGVRLPCILVRHFTYSMHGNILLLYRHAVCTVRATLSGV